MLHVSDLTEIAKRCPSLTDAEMAQYEATSPRPVFNTQNFRIDFHRSWAECEFNKEASKFFVENFLECVSGGMYRSPPVPSRFFTEAQVKGALDSHMSHARLVWKHGNRPPPPPRVAKRADDKRSDSRKHTVRHTVCLLAPILTLSA